ncbi:MAG: magnesium transporter, partial [Bacteroidota bacterium]
MSEDRIDPQNRIERVRELLRSPNAHVRALLGVLHPSEIAQVLENTSPEIQERILRELPRELLSMALAEMDDDTQPGDLLAVLHPEISAGLIKELAPDDAADLLGLLKEDYREKVLYYLPDEEELVLNQLLTYDEDSAGGLMNPEVVMVKENMTKLEALRVVVEQSEEREQFYAIYVTDDDNQLQGYLTFRALFLARSTELVKNIMSSDVVAVFVDDDQEDVARIMSQYNLPTLPVLDRERHLLGRVTFDDIMDVLEEESTEDILSFAGVSEDENLRGGWADAVKSRLPWLMVNLGTASLAAYVISQFGTTIEKLVLLTSLMPIIAGVSGNGATQTLAVTIRRISTNGVHPRQAFRVILKELSVGAIQGLMLGAVVSFAVAFLS